MFCSITTSWGLNVLFDPLPCREYLALNVYVALCYYKLDYYDVSQEVLAVYLQQVPDSTIALNLKACNHFRLFNGKAAEVSIGQPSVHLYFSSRFCTGFFSLLSVLISDVDKWPFLVIESFS